MPCAVIMIKATTAAITAITFISVHRIGRTGRSGRTGIATTFINKANDESVLLDLKHLLREAKQKIPPFLLELCSENEKYLNVGGKADECSISINDKPFYSIMNQPNELHCPSQMSKGAAIAVVLVTELPNARNWKRFRTSRPRISAVAIIWPAMPPIIESHFY